MHLLTTGAINSLMSSISVPFTAFALPCLVYIWIYRHQAARDASVLPPYKWLQVSAQQRVDALSFTMMQ
jgi:hypothetical protein